MSSTTDYNDYLDSLNNIINKATQVMPILITTPNTPRLDDVREILSSAGYSGYIYLQNLASPATLPATYSDFITALTQASSSSATYADYDKAFKDAYYASVLPGDDGTVLAASLGITVNQLKEQIGEQFENLYGTFAANFVYSDSSTNPAARFFSFFNQLHAYYNTNTVVISSSSSPVTVYNSAGVASSVTLPSYEQIYKMFFPGPDSDANFKVFLKQFYTDSLASGVNIFNPSVSYGAFIDAIQKEATKPTLYADSSVTTDQSGRPAVMNRIFALIVQMITTLQSVAAAQADRLTLYAQWTKAYTDAMNQLPSFSAYDPNSPIRNNDVPGVSYADFGSDDDRAKVRAELNDKVIAPITERLRSLRDNVTNDSKSLQSTVNNTNDAVSQQTNLATALLQELSTLLSAIYR